MGQPYFSPRLFQFLAQLRRNNRRAWFLKHKLEYEEFARQPSLRFITGLQLRLREVSPWLVANPKPLGGSLFRIYRDVRFSKDKSPYKTHIGMHFRHASSNEAVHGPGLYLHLEPKACFLAGGVWQPDPRSLARIRDAIAWTPHDWRQAKRGLELGGDTLSRAPRGYSPDHPLVEEAQRLCSERRIEGSAGLQSTLDGKFPARCKEDGSAAKVSLRSREAEVLKCSSRFSVFSVAD